MAERLTDLPASVITSLVPIAGAALAINLGYLYIPWFHYQAEIGKTAKKASRTGADSEAIISSKPNERGAKNIIYLKSLGNESGNKAKFSLPLTLTSLFILWFVARLDRIGVFIALIFAVSLLVVGCAHDMGLYLSFFLEIDDRHSHFYLHYSTLALIFPLGMSAFAKITQFCVTGYVLKEIGRLAVDQQGTVTTSFEGKPTP